MSTTSGQAQMVGLVGSLFTFGAPSISSKIRGLPLPSATATPPLSLLPHLRWSSHDPCTAWNPAIREARAGRRVEQSSIGRDGEGEGRGRKRGKCDSGTKPATRSPWPTVTREQLRSIRQPDRASNEFPPPVPDDPQPGCEIILRASRRNGQRECTPAPPP